MYLAGPMRGYPEHNVPAFREATTRLRDLGYDVVSPVEVADKWNGGAQDNHPPEEFVRRDILVMLARKCNAMGLLPGWQRSVGARCEVAIGITLGYQFFNASNGEPIDRPTFVLVDHGYGPAVAVQSPATMERTQ